MCANLPFGQSFGTLETGYYSLEQEPRETYSLVQKALFLLAVKRRVSERRKREQGIESALARVSWSIGRKTYRSLYSTPTEIKPHVCL